MKKYDGPERRQYKNLRWWLELLRIRKGYKFEAGDITRRLRNDANHAEFMRLADLMAQQINNLDLDLRQQLLAIGDREDLRPCGCDNGYYQPLDSDDVVECRRCNKGDEDDS